MNKVKNIQWCLSYNLRTAHPRETVSESITFCLDSVSHLGKKKGGGVEEVILGSLASPKISGSTEI